MPSLLEKLETFPPDVRGALTAIVNDKAREAVIEHIDTMQRATHTLMREHTVMLLWLANDFNKAVDSSPTQRVCVKIPEAIEITRILAAHGRAEIVEAEPDRVFARKVPA